MNIETKSERRWPRLVGPTLAIVFLLVGAACSSSGGDATPIDLTSEQSDETDRSGLLLWFDEVTAAIEETTTADDAVDPFMDSWPRAMEVLERRQGSAQALLDALPTAPDQGPPLLVRRYDSLLDALTALADASGAAITPDESSGLVLLGRTLTSWDEALLDVEEACFDVQEAADESELGLLGCTSLDLAPTDAVSIYESQAMEGAMILPQAGGELAGGVEPVSLDAARDINSIELEFACEPRRNALEGLNPSDVLVASARSLTTSSERAVLLETWVAADADTARALAEVLEIYIQTRKTCLGNTIGLITQGTDFDGGALAVERGVDRMNVESMDGRTLAEQFRYDRQGNVIGVVSVASSGELIADTELRDLASIMAVAGTRP